MSLAFRVSPEPVKTLIAPTAVAVDLIAQRILLIVVLVVLLCGVELGRRRDFGDDGRCKRFRRLQGLLRCLSEPLLRLIMVEDGGAILCTMITELSIGRRGVDLAPGAVHGDRGVPVGGDGRRSPLQV